MKIVTGALKGIGQGLFIIVCALMALAMLVAFIKIAGGLGGGGNPGGFIVP